MAEAMRSMPEWADSDNMPSEPVRMPVSSLRSVMTAAASTENSAAVRLGVRAGAAAGLMRKMVQDDGKGLSGWKGRGVSRNVLPLRRGDLRRGTHSLRVSQTWATRGHPSPVSGRRAPSDTMVSAGRIATMPQTEVLEVVLSDESLEFVREKVASGEYLSASEFLDRSLHSLMDEERELRRFEREEVIAAYEESLVNPSAAIPIDQVRRNVRQAFEDRCKAG